MKQRLKIILSIVLCIAISTSTLLGFNIVSAAATADYYTDANGNRTGIKSITTEDGKVYYDIADGGMLVDSANSVPEFYIKALTADLGGYSTAQIWANVASQVFEEAGPFFGFNEGSVSSNGAHFDTLFTQNSTASNGDFNLSEILASTSEFTTGDSQVANKEYAHSNGLAYYSNLNAVQEHMANELLNATTNNKTQTKNSILKGTTGSEDGFELLRDTTNKPVIATVATTRAKDPSDSLGLFSYSSFGIAFYDFELVPFSPEGVEFKTAAEGYDSLEEAEKNNAPGVKYNDTAGDSAFTSYTTNPTLSSSNVSVSFSETNSVSVSNTMQSTETHTFGTQTSVSAKLGLSIPKLFVSAGAGFSQSFTTQETIATAYSNGETITQTTSNTATAQVTLPAHTKIGITQKSSKIETVLDYDCPVYITYKVAMFAMNGYGGPSAIAYLGGMCANFGASDSINGLTACDNIYKRAIQYIDMTSIEESHNTYLYNSESSADKNKMPIDWKSIIDVKQNGGYKTLRECVEWLHKTIPLSAAGATITMLSNGMSTDLTGIEPLYNLDKVINTSSGAYNLAIGGSLDLTTVVTAGYNAYSVPYYGYLPLAGYWTICDGNGNNVNSSNGISLETASYRQILTANEIGDYYLKFNIKEDTYKDVNDKSKFITNADLSFVPIIKICVTQTGENHNCIAGDWKTTIPATCFMEGTQVQCCETCGIQMNVQTLEKLPHTSVKITTPATCTEDGTITEICGICNAEITSSVISATGHDEGVWKIDFEATADHNGQMSRYCTKCGDILETKEFDLHTHQFGYESITREPTCTENGEKGLFCSICNAMYATEQIEKHGHGETTAVISVQPTCTTAGEEKLYCTVCGILTGTNEIPATGHGETYSKIESEPTADRPGIKSERCKDCNAIISTEEFQLHTHEFGYESITREPTCTENGEKGLFCSICNAMYATEQIEKHGHGATVKVTTTKPTCTQSGETTHYCTDCGVAVETTEIEAYGHTEGVWTVSSYPTCIQEGEKVLSCDACGEVIDSEVIEVSGHDDGIWKVDFEATADHDGQMTKYCSICNAALESKSFQLHEHIYTSWKKNNDGTHSRNCYKCGFTESANCNYVANITSPDCTIGGYTTFVCSECSHTYVDNYTEPLGHEWGAWEECDDGCCHERECIRENCNATETQDHNWGEYVYNEDGTFFRNGTKTRTCFDCGATETVKAPKTILICRVFDSIIDCFRNIFK